MPSQIRPTRLEVSDRFPMLGFTIRTDGEKKNYEVAIGTDPNLFRADAKSQRTRGTFFSSRADGLSPVARGEAVYVVRPEVLARFVGQERLYFALATYADGRGPAEITSMPTADSPYINVRGLTGRSLQRVRVVPTRQTRGASYKNGSTSELEWGGDTIQPGTQTVAAPTPASNGTKAATPSSNGSALATNAAAFEYNDGFGPLPPSPAPKTRGANGSAPIEDLQALATRLGVENIVKGLLQQGASEVQIRELLTQLCRNSAGGAAQALSDEEPPTEDTYALLELLDQQPAVAASALVFDADDVEAAKKYAPKWVHLIRYQVPAGISSSIEARGMKVQKIEDAIGDLNLDFYPVRVSTFPTGFDGESFLQHVRTHINDFVDTRNSEFSPYDDSVDGPSWQSAAPDGSVIYINIIGPDDAAVVASSSAANRWRFSTVTTPRSGEHPVSGTREFGFFVDSNGDHVFYTRGADRSTGARETMGDFLTYGGADQLWKSFQNKLVAFVNANGGSAAPVARFSERFKWSVVNILLSPQGSSLVLGQSRRPVRAVSRGLAVSPIPVDEAKPVKLPAARPATTAERIAIEAAAAVVSGPFLPMVLGLRALTDKLNISVAVGPSAGVGFVLGMGVGAGVIFSPGGKVGVYGKFEVSGGLLDSIFAGSQLTIVRGGIEEFNEVSFAVGGAFVEGVAANVQVLFNAEHGFRGISFLMGVGLAIEPLELFIAIEGSLAEGVATTSALANESYSLNWDEVELIPQPNDVTCWATAAAMLIGWRDRISLTPEAVADIAGRSTKTGLSPNDCRPFAGEIGLAYEPPQSYTIDGFRNLLETFGPLWVTVQLPGSGHAILVTGLYSDGAPDGTDTFVRICDPWDRVVGAPGAPGPYLNTHNTGSRYILSWSDFCAEYEGFASTSPSGSVNVQILHAPDNGGRAPGRSGAVGYAMSVSRALGGATKRLPRPPVRVRRGSAFGTDEAAASRTIDRVAGGDGGVTWELDQLRGYKHLKDIAPTQMLAFRDATTIRLDQWPNVDNERGERTCLWLSIDWQFNGSSLGNVRIANAGAKSATGQTLHATAQVLDDGVVSPPSAPTLATLLVRVTYRFASGSSPETTAMQDIRLYGDGTYETSGDWEK